ncbi:hypothetical protein bcgnr5390_58210 [Bacillus luti]
MEKQEKVYDSIFVLKNMSSKQFTSFFSKFNIIIYIRIQYFGLYACLRSSNKIYDVYLIHDRLT